MENVNFMELAASIAAKYAKGDKATSLTEEIVELINAAKATARTAAKVARPGHIMYNDKEYRWCSMAKCYMPLDGFVMSNGIPKNYHKASYAIWAGFNSYAKKLEHEVLKDMVYNGMTKEEADKALANAQAYKARKDNPEEYKKVREQYGLTDEQVAEAEANS